MNPCNKGGPLQPGWTLATRVSPCKKVVVKKSLARRLTLETRVCFEQQAPPQSQWRENSEVGLCKKMQCFEGDEWGSAAELLPRMPCVVEPCKIEKTVGRVV